MTMTDDRPAVIAGYGENTSQPPPDAGGSIAEVEAARDPRPYSERKKEKSPCDICGKSIVTKNMGQHKRNIHGIYKGRGGKRTAPAEAQPKQPPKPRAARLTAEEIILTVVAMRWPNGVPINKVSALLEWQRDTERFLNE